MKHDTSLKSYLEAGWSIVGTTAFPPWDREDYEENGRTFVVTIQFERKVRALLYNHFVPIEDDEEEEPYRAHTVKILA